MISLKHILNILLIVLLISLISFPGLNCSGNDEQISDNPFYVSPSSYDFSKNPALLERVLADPHGYFRLINIVFSNEVCHKFSHTLLGAPSLNLHGDAHIEQYAVTDLGRGLTDFDDSSTGPSIIDWMRFGVSSNLACRAHKWDKRKNELFGQFIKGYRDALNNPQIAAPEPAIVQRIKSTFKTDRKKYFAWVDTQMEPMPARERDSLITAIRPYVETMVAENNELKRSYFKIVNMGYLHMGIGSALDLKYLVRVQGNTGDPLDDVVLEIKEVRDLSGIDCINTGQKNDPFRILLGQARIAYQPFHHLGYFQFRGQNFWVHSWVDNYKEVEIGETFQSFGELAEVAYDIGVQLGKGHVKHIAAPLDFQVQRKQLDILDQYEPEFTKACNEFADAIIEAWENFFPSTKTTK